MSKRNREAQEKAQAADAGSRWADYFWANLIFFCFLFLLAFVVRASCEAPGDDQTPAVKIVLDDTFKFLLTLFGGGFVLVTLFDAAYEFFAGKAQEEASGDGAPRA